MVFRLLRIVLLAALLAFMYIPGLPIIPRLVVPHPVSAESFTLFGRIMPLSTAGWGSTASTTKSPGPTLIVSAGASVTLTLFSADSMGHIFCVDYEATPDFICDGNEPLSPLFSSPTIPTTYTFTATTVPGNYTYYCTIHLSPMVGTFRVLPAHDVAVSGIVASRSFAYAGVSSNPLQLNVTAANLGTSAESFFVSAQANSTLIGNQTVGLAPGQTSIVTFSWNTQSLVRGNYTLVAKATPVPGETNLSNNIFSGNIFTVKLRGDVNGDCRVDILDIGVVTGGLGHTFGVGDPRLWRPVADLNNDGVINILDIGIVTGYLGHNCQTG